MPITVKECATDVIRFTYQRFSDHCIAAKLLDDSLHREEPEKSFEPGSPMGRLFADPESGATPGILDALSVQLPERCDRELMGLLPEQHRDNWLIEEAFIESILWVRSAEDLPDFPTLVEVSRPNDGRRWLVLNSFSRGTFSPNEPVRFI